MFLINDTIHLFVVLLISRFMSSYSVIDIPLFEDERGKTIPVELEEKIPFKVRRIYFVTGKKGFIRGGHAHREEQEVFVCIQGSVRLVLNDAAEECEIMLDIPRKDLGWGVLLA